jgi:hypothetical protein
MMGIGAVLWLTPHFAIALTDWVVAPFSIPAKNVGIVSVTVTCMNGWAATVTDGVVIPGTVPGNDTETLFPSPAVPAATELSKPFKPAYTHGE